MNWVASGSATSSTAQVKWIPLDPYLDAAGATADTLANVHLLLTDLLNGGRWTVIFLPEGFAWPLAFGALSLWWIAAKGNRKWRALMISLLLLATLAPASYSTMLWNRVRYIWPFAGGWFVTCACGAVLIGETLAKRYAWLRIVTPILLWGGVAALAAKLDWATNDLAQSARAITLQQVKLGQWARTELPAGSRIGVNDTGAIAYFSRHETFDVVGLTTSREARYWAAGAGSRLEHYESMPPAELPTHYIVYDNWMAMGPLLGAQLFQATVIEQSILGNDTMVVYRANYDALGSGALPTLFKAPSSDLIDELDVSDLSSELSHGYERGSTLARYNVARSALSAAETIVDGGRMNRAEDRFSLKASPAAVLVIRASSSAPLEVHVGAERIGESRVVADFDTWQQQQVRLPSADSARLITVRPTDGRRFTSYHYWLYPSG